MCRVGTLELFLFYFLAQLFVFPLTYPRNEENFLLEKLNFQLPILVLKFDKTLTILAIVRIFKTLQKVYVSSKAFPDNFRRALSKIPLLFLLKRMH